jgi:sulfite reductase (NADPH) flavoprotein alpha-component
MLSSLAAAGEARLLAACLLALAYVVLAGYFLWPRRRSADPIIAGDGPDAPILVAFASQTGFAEQLARQTTDALRSSGTSAALTSFAYLDPTRLAKIERALFIVSTTGEGDAPDCAARFVRDMQQTAPSLQRLKYGVLALGDREYSHFCAFGHRLDQWLRHHGAQAMFDPVEVDNGDDAALRHWQHQLGLITGTTIAEDWQPPAYERWRIHERRLLNPGDAEHACYHIELRPCDGEPRNWSAGDVVEIGPRRTRDDRELQPHREYSIASIPQDGGLHLLVRQMRNPDGTLGLGSGWLTHHATLEDDIALRIRSNSNFHLPDDARPILFVGNGTGIAGLRALLKARIAAGHFRNWLVFGERSKASDYYYGEEIDGWLQRGQLERLDLVFSRDQQQRRYVQHRLLECGAELREWVAAGASIYVCGSLAGMAPGVDAALNEVLGRDAVETLLVEGRYRRDVY